MNYLTNLTHTIHPLLAFVLLLVSATKLKEPIYCCVQECYLYLAIFQVCLSASGTFSSCLLSPVPAELLRASVTFFPWPLRTTAVFLETVPSALVEVTGTLVVLSALGLVVAASRVVPTALRPASRWYSATKQNLQLNFMYVKLNE